MLLGLLPCPPVRHSPSVAGVVKSFPKVPKSQRGWLWFSACHRHLWGRKGVCFSFCTGQLCTAGREQSTLEARLAVGTVAPFEQEEGFQEPNANDLLLSSQASARLSPISPPRLSLRILSKQDPSLATVCCSISSSCGVCAPLLPSHHLYPEGLLRSWHHQY